MASPCSICGKTVDHANVMVDDKEWTDSRELSWVKVVCKPCTNHLDNQRVTPRMHNLYELSALRERPLDIVADVFKGLLGEAPNKWSQQAVWQLWEAIGTERPDLYRGPLF